MLRSFIVECTRGIRRPAFLQTAVAPRRPNSSLLGDNARSKPGRGGISRSLVPTPRRPAKTAAKLTSISPIQLPRATPIATENTRWQARRKAQLLSLGQCGPRRLVRSMLAALAPCAAVRFADTQLSAAAGQSPLEFKCHGHSSRRFFGIAENAS